MTSSASYHGKIKLLLLDVDGVLTDGTVTVSGEGEAQKTFNVRDGLAVALLRAHGIATGVLSGKASAPLDFRIRQLGIDIAMTGSLNKSEAFERILAEHGLESTAVAYVGDDVVDLPLVGRVGYFYAPADAHALVAEQADHVLSLAGGRGVGREAAEHVLKLGGLTLHEAYAPLIGQWKEHHAVQ